jgi:TusA-related sulfurtransferase
MGREEKSKTAAPTETLLDLRGVACPLNWAKAKVRLAALPPGEELVLWLDDPKGARDIPRAAEAEGYAVEGPEPQDGTWLIRITV